MIAGAVPFMEATLNRREQFIFLQVPDQSVVDHTFHDHTNATRKCNGAVTTNAVGLHHVENLRRPHPSAVARA